LKVPTYTVSSSDKHFYLLNRSKKEVEKLTIITNSKVEIFSTLKIA